MKAARSIQGHLDCLKYAHENGCPWKYANIHAQMQHTMAIQIALSMLMRMAVRGMKDTCADAAYKGHLDCLKYAHENGCPWDERNMLRCSIQGAFRLP